jgi:hypothetical protein
MKNNNEKQLHFVSNHWLKLLIMTKLCILLLICSMTTVSAGKAFSEKIGSADLKTVITDLDAFQQNTVKGTIKDAVTESAL